MYTVYNIHHVDVRASIVHSCCAKCKTPPTHHHCQPTNTQVSPNLHAAQRLVKSVAAPPMYDSTPPTINTKRQRPSAPAAAAARLRLVCIDSDESDDFA